MPASDRHDETAPQVASRVTAERQENPSLPDRSPALFVSQPPWKTLQGGLVAALGLFASDVGYGFIAYAALGYAYANTGIIAAFLASVIGTLIPALVRGSGPMFGGPRPAQTLIFAAMISSLVGHPGAAITLERVAIAGITCVTLAGLIQIAFGALGLGRIIRFTPLPVLAGFTNGVALSMMLSALFIIFNGSAPGQGVMSIATLYRLEFVAVLLILMASLYRRFPQLHWSMMGLIMGTLLHAAMTGLLPELSLGEMLPAVTSLHPSSGIMALPLGSLLRFDWHGDLLLIVAPAVSLATLNSLESLIHANQQDQATGARYNSTRVLVGQGLANMLCGLLGALPSAPSNSRQLVSKQMGGNTWGASIAFAITMLFILIMTPHFVGIIPKIAVAALLLFMAVSIIDPWAKNQIHSWWHKEGNAEFQGQLRNGLWVMFAVMTVAVTINLVAAMAVGVLLSMMLFVRLNSRSIIARIYFADKRHSAVMRPLSHSEYLRTHGQRIALVELSGPLFFGSGELLMDEVETLSHQTSHIILDFRHVATIDASGGGAVRRIALRLAQRGVRLALSSLAPHSARGRMIASADKQNVLGEDAWYDDADLALEAAEDALLESGALHDIAATGRSINIEALRGLDDVQIAIFLDYTEENTYAKGDFLFRRNDPGDTLYLLLSGKVEIRVPIKGGPSKRLIELRSGTLFGEMAILRGAPRSADAQASVDGTEVLSLTQASLDRLHREHPDIALSLMRSIGIQLAARLASVTDELRYALVSNHEQP